VKVRLLQSAFDDLDDGAAFYEEQESGVGGYFVDSLLSDIDSLALTEASIGSFEDITVRCPNDSRSQSTIG